MIKILALSIGISSLPLTQKIVSVQSIKPSYEFNFKNIINYNPFSAKKDKENTNPEDLKQGSWYANALQNIEQSEYHFKWEEKLKAYCTPNRKNNFRFFYDDKGFTVEPRTTQIPVGDVDPMAMPNEIKYLPVRQAAKTIPNLPTGQAGWKVKFNLDKNQVGKGFWKLAENKAEYITDKITVQYINNEEGMRQNFIVHQPLSKSDKLNINLNIKTKLKTVLKNNRLQFSHKKNIVLNYEDLKVWDVTGRILPSCFQKKDKNKFYIQVDTKDAVYPITIDPISTTAAARVESNQAEANMGFSAASAGDVNGDGYSDVIVGANLYDNGQTDEGAAFVYHGSASGISTAAAAMVESNQVSAYMGVSAASAGDVNGDGYSDVIVGAEGYDNGQTNEGAAFVYHGSASGISNTAAAMVQSSQAGAYMGFSAASAGDVNGDGYSDVIVGADSYTNGQTYEGAAFVYHGSPAGISTISTASLENNQASANYGNAVTTAGDVNGDGFSDVIIASQYYDNGEINEGAVFVYLGTANGISTTISSTIEGGQIFSEIGSSVSTAGDINADGYSDIIIGARYYDNGEHLEGGGLVFYGSPSGINTSSFDLLEVNQPDAFFGYSVANAGDVNGDGYGDIIAGAYLYDNPEVDEGAAFIFLGSSTGISLVPNITLQSNQANAFFGYSVAGAGDVNGDGYSDVIVGAYNYTNNQANEGVVFIFLGSPSGTITTYSTLLEHNQSNAAFGYCVSGTGDVNGDGFSDIVIGSIKYSNGQSEEGSVFVYGGSSTGINTTPVFITESNQNFAEMGNAIGNAGDVNGDGYSDLIIGVHNYDNGQTDEGQMLLYYGSNTGLSITNVSSFESNQASSNMGRSVNSAGDVNGDGFSDILAGAPFYDNGETDEGFVFLLQGNPFGSSLNKRNNLRLYNSNLTTPLNSSNFLFGNFGAGLYAKSFLGRAKGKLVWETRLNYNPYSGTPITNSTFFTAQQATYTNLGLTGVELKNVITKILGSGKFTKLRARVKYDPVTAITGQVYGPWRNVSSIIDANFIGVLPINLISFNASWQQKGSIAKIDFVTDKEYGTCCFDIQKSKDGFNFTTIGTIAAKNTSGKQVYSFIDDKATNKKQFYRLKIKGTAGQLQYSNIQQLQNDKATEILVFPNPTANVLQLQLNKNYNSMQVQIINALGQIVKQYTNLSPQNQTLQIPVKALAYGNYWLHLQGDGEKQVLQFVKQ